MSIALDGFKVLKRIGEAPEVFRAVRVEADKAARTLVVKCLKAKSTGIDHVREMRKALHDKQFELVVEILTDAEIKSLLARLDKHHPEMKTLSAQERRRHLLMLAGGTVQPAEQISKAKKSKKGSKKVVVTQVEPERLQSSVADLIRERAKEREDE